MIAPPTLLVALDGSTNAAAALSVARGLAHLKGATVLLNYVGAEALAPDELLGRMRLSAEDVRGLVIDQSTGSPAGAVVREAAARHDVLIVMCAPGRSAGPLHTFGDVLEEILLTAPCPVVLVPSIPGRDRWSLRQLVMPHDGTPTSAAAIAPMADLASRADAELVVLHVATPDAERLAEAGSFVVPRYLDQPQHEWPAWSREFLGRVRCFCHSANIEKIRLVLARGEAGAAIVEFARHNASDLIALAWRGTLEPERAKTIRRVVHDASCPVMIFRMQA